MLDPCGPLADGNGPLFGISLDSTSDLWMHGVVKNCAGVIDQVSSYLPGSS